MDLLTKFKIDIVTPEKIIYSDNATMLVLPGEDGEFAVLHNHIPIVSSIKEGFILIYDNSTVIEKFFVEDGFVEVTSNEGTVVLVDRAFPAMNVKLLEIEQIISELRNKLNVDIKDFENYLIEKDIEFYNKLITAISDK
jgi:F-type H+-transporting ATPase subunit epsilon